MRMLDSVQLVNLLLTARYFRTVRTVTRRRHGLPTRITKADLNALVNGVRAAETRDAYNAAYAARLDAQRAAVTRNKAGRLWEAFERAGVVDTLGHPVLA